MEKFDNFNQLQTSQKASTLLALVSGFVILYFMAAKHFSLPGKELFNSVMYWCGINILVVVGLLLIVIGLLNFLYN